jgi:hypothetical protein
MLKIISIMGLVFLGLFANAQEYVGDSKPSQTQTFEPKTSISLGLLHAGSIIGVDLEFLLVDYVGLQIGAGFIGFDAGLTLHVQPEIRSSYFLFNFVQTGTGDVYLKMLNGSFVYRSNKWFQASVGVAFPQECSVTMANEAFDGNVPDVLLTYSIGAYFPLK